MSEIRLIQVAPIDGEGLIEQMHTRGINVRYLGQIAKLVCLLFLYHLYSKY